MARRPGTPALAGTARRRRAQRATLFALAALTAACAPPPDPTWTLEGEAFGTRWTVRIRGPETDAQSVRAAIEAELDAVDRSMSNWRDDSELSRLNASEATDPQPVSEPLALVLEAAFRVHQESGGAFDVTVGPLLRLYGFGPGGDPGSAAPDPAAVEAARARVGSGLLALQRPDGPAALWRQVPGVELDLSGIAKGYAVDRVSTMLTELGFAEHLVEVGGEIQARGGWTVGIQDPTGSLATTVHRSFPVRDLGMATSGGYRDFREAAGEGEGRFWTHILDPRLGRPVERRAGSVTVLAESCLDADAWATALFVLGPEEGLELASQRGIRVLFLTAAPDGSVQEQATDAFRAATERQP
ncbi:MAG: FAD:protein FMN transferase [Acidobacteriota bacterium]|nr:FAD:protein FMN transferase [Acidobacteriota bacterium]